MLRLNSCSNINQHTRNSERIWYLHSLCLQFCNIAKCTEDAYKQSRAVNKRQTGAMVICSECCYHDNCNIQGCGGSFVGRIVFNHYILYFVDLLTLIVYGECYFCVNENIYTRPLRYVHNRFCMNRTTFRDLWVGGVLVETCIIALRRSTFLKKRTNPFRYQIQFCIWAN